MRVAVIGTDGVIGRGVAERLTTKGHSVIGIAPVRPVGLPQAVEFVETHVDDVAAIQCAIAGADAVAHCANDGMAAVLQAMAAE
ncbi:MAG TPA: NAD-dependent epimerase/dehydratase family protein, partial [Mycobacterium sp.]|nr:NAD-dependent epimerase/dehydratase family protein [Mycobacterium sp.]